MASDTKTCLRTPSKAPLRPNEWAIISTVYSIFHCEFTELTAILFWCSTKLPVLQYSLLYRCYIAKLFIATTKQTRKYSWNGGFVSNVYISKTNSTWGQLTKHGWAPSHGSLSIYIRRLRCQQTLDRSCCMTAAHPPTFIYHRQLRTWNVLASWFSSTIESQNTNGTRIAIFPLVTENCQQTAQDQTYYIYFDVGSDWNHGTNYPSMSPERLSKRSYHKSSSFKESLRPASCFIFSS